MPKRWRSHRPRDKIFLEMGPWRSPGTGDLDLLDGVDGGGGRWLRHRQRDSDDVTKNKHANVCMAKSPRKKTEKLTYLKDNL